MSPQQTARLLRGIMPKEYRDVVRDALKRGWELSITGGNHVKLTHPSGRIVIGALTSSDHRSVRNMQRHIRRVEEGRPT